MKEYIKPQIETKEFEVSDIITASGSVFNGLADLDKSESVDFGIFFKKKSE
jgi:hypothetical protein